MDSRKYRQPYIKSISCTLGEFVLVETAVLDFGRRSFVEWDLKDGFYERLSRAWQTTQLQLMFRTRRQSGLLFKAQNYDKFEYVLLEVRHALLSPRVY